MYAIPLDMNAIPIAAENDHVIQSGKCPFLKASHHPLSLHENGFRPMPLSPNILSHSIIDAFATRILGFANAHMAAHVRTATAYGATIAARYHGFVNTCFAAPHRLENSSSKIRVVARCTPHRMHTPSVHSETYSGALFPFL